MKSKECFKCRETKPITEFYKHKQMDDGHLNKCKTCTKKDAQDRYNEKIQDPTFKEAEKKRHRDKYHRLGYKNIHKPDPKKKRETIKRYRQKYPEKTIAKRKSQKLRVKGKKNELHHWSYNSDHYVDVIELSVKNHNIAHRHLHYDQDNKMYKTDSGTLLKTKSSHKAYIQCVINLWTDKREIA